MQFKISSREGHGGTLIVLTRVVGEREKELGFRGLGLVCDLQRIAKDRMRDMRGISMSEVLKL
jgi:hypothetical protein